MVVKVVLTRFEVVGDGHQLEFIGISPSLKGEYVSLIIPKGKMVQDGVDVVDLMATAIVAGKTITVVAEDKDWEIGKTALKTRAPAGTELMPKKRDDRTIKRLRIKPELAQNGRDPKPLVIEGLKDAPAATVSQVPDTLLAFAGKAKELAKIRAEKKAAAENAAKPKEEPEAEKEDTSNPFE